MKPKYTILIADRNSHVRGFLKREMMAEGYRIQLTDKGQEVLRWAYNSEPLDLIILDPDLPDIDVVSLFKKLLDRIPKLPIIIHAFHSDYNGDSFDPEEAVFVEKRGNSIEHLKKAVQEILRAPKSAQPSSSPKKQNGSRT